jgi:hypothetical protein
MIVLVLIVLHLTILLAIDKRNIISPVNALLVWVWLMVFRATEIVLFGQRTLPEWAAAYITDGVMIDALLIIGLFVTLFLIGYSFPISRSPETSNQKLPLPNERMLPMPCVFLMALGGAMAAKELLTELPDLLGVVFLSQGDPAEFFRGKGWLITGLSLLPSSVLGMLIARRTTYGFALTSLFLVGIAFIVYAPLGQRGNILTYIVLALSVLTAKFPRMKLRYLISIGLLVVLGMGTLVLWRTAIRWDSTFDDEDLKDFYGTQGVDRGDFDAFAGVVAYNVSIEYDSWWSFAVQLIPRFLYPSKEGYIAVSYLMNDEIIGEYNSGLTTTIIGTLFAQGGITAVATGGLIMGMFVSLLQKICSQKLPTPNRVLLGGVSTAFILFLTRNGDLTNVVVMLVSNLMGVFVLMGLIAAFPTWQRTKRDFFGTTDRPRANPI